ncbi:MAG: hypothetical protein AB1589_46360, partial [Cyanobacteriota bacterium]
CGRRNREAFFMLLRKLILAVLCLTLVVAIVALPVDANFRLSSDRAIEESLTYQTYSAELKNRLGESYPFNGFSIAVDRTGIGQLHSSCTNSRKYPRPATLSQNKGSDGFFQDWAVRTTYLTRKGWIQLNFLGAKELWGEPRMHCVTGRDFYTFDASSVYNNEPNIYHLDLSFDENKVLDGFRVRGIGITTPSWITKQGLSSSAEEETHRSSVHQN